MKFVSRFLTIIVSFLILSTTAFAHPGRTDANGGHYDRKTGTYHYHNGGHSSSSNGVADSQPKSYELPSSIVDPSKPDPYAAYWFNGEPDLNISTLSNYQWVHKSNKTYCLNTDTNKYVSGLKKIDGKVYVFDRKGIMRKGWMKTYGNIYYFGSKGNMLIGTYTINDNTYTFDESGKLVQGRPVYENVIPIAAYIDKLEFIGGLYVSGNHIIDRIEKERFTKSDVVYIRGRLVGSTLGSVPLRIEITNPDGDVEEQYLTLDVNSYEREVLFIPDTFLATQHTGNVSIFVDATNQKLTSFDYYVEF